MRYNLNIRVSDKPRNGGVVACRTVSIREKLFTLLLGPKQKVMVVFPVTRSSPLPSPKFRWEVVYMSKVKLLLDVVEDLRSLADSVQAVADAMLQNEPTVDAEAKTPAPVPKELTLEEVRAVLGEKSRAGFTAEIQALLKKYGAPKLSGIDPKHYEALLKDVEVLKDAP